MVRPGIGLVADMARIADIVSSEAMPARNAEISVETGTP